MILLILTLCLMAKTTAEHSLTTSPKHEIPVENTDFGKNRGINFKDNFGEWHKIWEAKPTGTAGIQHETQHEESNWYYLQPPAYLLVDTIRCKPSNNILPPKISFKVQFWSDEIAAAASSALRKKINIEIDPDDIYLIPINEMWLALANPNQRLQGVLVDSYKMSLSNNERGPQKFSLIMESDTLCEAFAAELSQDPDVLTEMVTIEVGLMVVHETSRTLTVSKKHIINGTLYSTLREMNPTNGQRLLTTSQLTHFAKQITIEVVSTEIVEPYYYVSDVEQLQLEKKIEMSISQVKESSRSTDLNWDLVYWPPYQVRPDRAIDYLTIMLLYDEDEDLFTIIPDNPPEKIEDPEEYERTRRNIKDVMVFNYTKNDEYDGSEGVDISSAEVVPVSTDPPTETETTETETSPFSLTSQNIDSVLKQCGLSVEWSQAKRQFAIESFVLHSINLTSLSAASVITTKKVKMIPAIVRDTLSIVVPKMPSNVTVDQLQATLNECRKELNSSAFAGNMATASLRACNAKADTLNIINRTVSSNVTVGRLQETLSECREELQSSVFAEKTTATALHHCNTKAVCSALAAIANGMIHYSPSAPVGSIVPQNTIATLTCNSGYFPTSAGPTTSICRESSMWSAALTTCSPVVVLGLPQRSIATTECDDPALLLRSPDGTQVRFSCAGTCGSSKTIGTRITVSCSKYNTNTVFDVTFDDGTTALEDTNGFQASDIIVLICNSQAKWETEVSYNYGTRKRIKTGAISTASCRPY